MTRRHFSKTPPDRANELFDKLLATSDNAVKTRERLFADLKEELQLLAGLQEEHLFPVLREHGMNDLLRDATSDNEETNALLAELDHMPKNGGEFLAKVAELRRVFQQHIRNDRKELLPAVLEVLSDEETDAVTERVEDDVASFEEARRAQSSLIDGQVQMAQPLANEAMDAMQTATVPAQVVAHGVQDLSRECLRMSQKRLQTNLEGLNRLTQCRSPQDWAAVQASLMRDNFEQTLANTFRFADLTMQLTEKAMRNTLR
ncbi:phasin family protein [Microvirga roseola]|uniref:phasin family protein n=1 Tax=Microvirga roseola TaxID=2883126 RepID=UPI001E3791DC|nr:phasin family protein [Microvirga roseola]